MRNLLTRRSARFCTLIPVLLLVGACASDDESATTDDAATTDATVEAAWLDDLAASYETHYNAGHADMVAALYTEDAVVLAADGTVADGRAAVQAWIERQMASGSPQVDIGIVERKVFGDTALAIGEYVVTVTPAEGEAMEIGGHWMGAWVRSPDGWRMAGLISNHDRQMSAEHLQGPVPTEPPPDESTMDELLGAYETAWNAGNADGIAELYAEDAWAAFMDLPPVRGRAAIASAMEQRIPGSRIALQGARTVDLGDGWQVDGGMFETTRTGGDASRGHYWVLTHTGEDGATRIHWALSNGRPVSVIPAAGGM